MSQANTPFSLDLSSLKALQDFPLEETLHSVAPQNCKANQESNFSYVALVFEKDQETKTLNIPAGCRNLAKGYVHGLEAGNWAVSATIYDNNYQPKLDAHAILNVAMQKKTVASLVFKDTTAGPLSLNNKTPDYAIYESSFVPVSLLQPYLGNFLTIAGSPEDYISGGQQYAYGQGDFSLAGFKNLLQVQMNEGSDSWASTVALPSALPEVKAGIYADLARYSFHNSSKGGFDWAGNGRGCNQSVSWVAIDQVTYEAGSLKSIDYRFGQHCEGNANTVLLGIVHWITPSTHVGFNWQPAQNAVPATGSYIYLDSEKTDYIGGGEKLLFTPADAQLSIAASNNVLSVNVRGDTSWSGAFAVPETNGKLVKGKFIDLKRYPFHNPVKGGLNWDGEGRGCNALNGWFIIDDVSYVDNPLKSIDLRFDQHCDNNVGGLRGKIHWVNTR